MDQAKWESSKNIKNSYGVIAQDIVNCNIGISNPNYKDTEGGIKVPHCGNLNNMVIIHYKYCIV